MEESVKGFRKALFAFLFSVAAVGVSSASDIYIAQNAAGANTGADCNDAHSAAWFNSSSNWGSGSGQIGAGTTVHLCGTITTELSFQGSGTSGNVITLLFEAGAKVQISPGMDSNGIIALGANNFIILDGGSACGWNTATNASKGSCNGVIRNMLYGSPGATCPGGACTTQYSSTGNSMIKGTGHDIEIRNLEIGPAYVHTATGAGAADMSGGAGCITAETTRNWNIHDNKLHDGAWCINIQFNNGNMTGVTVANNEMYNNSHHLAVDGGNHALNGFTLSGNYVHDMFNWDTTGDAWHANVVHFFTAANNGTVSNVAIYNNIFGGNTGADVTGMIFNESTNGYTNFVIFNNLHIATTSPDAGSSNHFWGPAQCNSGCYVLNNTMTRQTVTGGNLDLGYSTYSMSATIENNANQGASWLTTVSASSPSITLDYNAYGTFGNGWQYHGSSYDTFASWRSASTEGTHSFYKPSLGLSGTYAPSSGSPLIAAGVNICTQNPTFCTNYPAIKKDMAGNVRPTSGNWDVGAYQYATGGSGPPPTGLAAVVH
jgi:hypothetical protein